MKKHFALIIASAAVGFLALSQPVLAQQKTVKACEDEWKANKEANQAKKITEKAYVETCRAGTAAAAPAAPAAAPKTAAPAPAPAAAPAPKTAAPAPASAPAAPKAATTAAPATGSPAGAGQYAAETQAKAHCPSDTVVWVNLDSKIFHFAGHKDYGHTKEGAYMCEKETAAAGFRAAKNEKQP